MRKTTIKLPAHKPRNPVARALLSRIGIGSGRHAVHQAKRHTNKVHHDLAQRVREVGER
jgi:hypothetical protein